MVRPNVYNMAGGANVLLAKESHLCGRVASHLPFSVSRKISRWSNAVVNVLRSEEDCHELEALIKRKLVVNPRQNIL